MTVPVVYEVTGWQMRLENMLRRDRISEWDLTHHLPVDDLLPGDWTPLADVVAETGASLDLIDFLRQQGWLAMREPVLGAERWSPRYFTRGETAGIEVARDRYYFRDVVALTLYRYFPEWTLEVVRAESAVALCKEQEPLR